MVGRSAFLPFTVPDPAYRPDAPPDLTGVPVVDVDLETTGLDRFTDRPVGIAVGAPGRTWYLPFGHRGGGNLDEAAVQRWAHRELRGKRIRNLHTKFDLHLFASWGVDLRDQGNTFHDVAHSEALLDDYETKFSLAHLAEKRLGDQKGKLDLPGEAISQLPASAVAAYAKQDVALVAALADVYAPLLRADRLGRVSALEDAIIPVCVELERNGVPLDLDRLQAWNASSERLVERLTWDLYRQVGFLINPDAPSDMARLWRRVGEPVRAFTAHGQPSFTAEVVQDAATRHPAIALAWRLGKLIDLRNKYLVKYLKDQRDGVLYPTFNQLMTDEGGTISGRFSCVKPNLQQVMAANKHARAYGWLTEYGPEDYLIKRLFRAPAGHQWISADMKQQEYRIFTHYSESPRLLAKYAEDPMTNFHKYVEGMIRPVRPDINSTEVKVFNFLCVVPETPVLTNDLRWVPAGSLHEGDTLLAFDEHQRPGVRGRAGARRWRTATVVNNTPLQKPCVAVVLANGDIVTCTEDHQWVVKNKTSKVQLSNKWVLTRDLKPGDHLLKVVDRWQEDCSKDAGWLAGFFDGEGNATNATCVSVAQNPGPALDRVRELLRSVVPDFSVFGNKVSRCHSVRINGRVSDRLRFLGRIRPVRLIHDFVRALNGRMFQAQEFVRVVDVRPVGVRRVVAVGTTTRTFIAAGYASHNSVYGGGAGAAARQLKISLPEAEALAESYHAAFPEARQTLQRAMAVAQDRGYVRTFLGRRCRFRGPRFNRERAHKALNAVVQGTGADYNKLALVAIYEARKALDVTMRLTTHDATDVTQPVDGPLTAYTALLHTAFLPLRVPIPWDVKVGPTWGEAS